MKNNYRLPKAPLDVPNCFLAGGAILSMATKQLISDYDIYPKSREAITDAIIYLINEESCFVECYTSRAISLKSNIQYNEKGDRMMYQVMIFDTFPTPESIFKSFDFTVCMGAYDCDEKTYHFHEDFWPDIASKTLRFNEGTKYPLNSLMRVHKYNKKGYILPKSQSIKMGICIANTDVPDNWNDLEEMIGGQYGKVFSLNPETKTKLCTPENIYEVLDDIDNIELYEREFEDCMNILSMFDKGDETKVEIAVKTILKEKIDVVKTSGGQYYYYDKKENKITHHKLFGKNDKMDSSVEVHENIFLISYCEVKESDGKYVARSGSGKWAPHSTYKGVSLSINEPDNFGLNKNYPYKMEVIYNSDDIISINNYSTTVNKFRVGEIAKVA